MADDFSSIDDFRWLFYGGGTAEELAFLKAAHAAGITAVDILAVAQGELPDNSVSSGELEQIPGKGVLGRIPDDLGDVQFIPWATLVTELGEISAAPGSIVIVEHVQSTPSAEWVISSPFIPVPDITVIDSADELVEGDEYYDFTNDNVILKFSGGFSGKAYLKGVVA